MTCLAECPWSVVVPLMYLTYMYFPGAGFVRFPMYVKVIELGIDLDFG